MSSIRRAQPRTLYLVQDGPRTDRSGEAALVETTRRVAEDVDWECDVTSVYAEKNMGLRQRVATGLDKVFSEVERAIILEDDCVANESFFRFAQDMLEHYADDSRVGSVSGNNFLRGKTVTDDSYFFSPDVRIWGWATWRRVWQDFSSNGLTYQWSSDEAARILDGFPSPARRRTLIRMAEQAPTLNSWALPFVLHCQRREYVSVVPGVNLVKNIGFGSLSTHTRFESFTDDIPTRPLDFPLRHPAQVTQNATAGRLETRLHRRLWLVFPLRHPLNFLGRIARYLRAR